MDNTLSGSVDVVAENVEVRLWDSQWVNVVNHADCYRDMDKEEAIATAVRMTERLMAENITKGFPPSAYNRAAVAELIERARALRSAHCAFQDWKAKAPERYPAPRSIIEMNVHAKAMLFAALDRVGAK